MAQLKHGTVVQKELSEATKYIQYSKFYEYDLYNRIVQYAYEVLKNKYEYDIDLIPIEIYANGQSKGQSGNWHQDSTNENLWTFLYYVNTEWTNPHWGGCTHFADYCAHGVHTAQWARTQTWENLEKTLY